MLGPFPYRGLEALGSYGSVSGSPAPAGTQLGPSKDVAQTSTTPELGSGYLPEQSYYLSERHLSSEPSFIELSLICNAIHLYLYYKQ